jgi:hypothetical protein
MSTETTPTSPLVGEVVETEGFGGWGVWLRA